eukprot:Selendium_serpulae@DN7199_c0_g1_i1.p1
MRTAKCRYGVKPVVGLCAIADRMQAGRGRSPCRRFGFVVGIARSALAHNYQFVRCAFVVAFVASGLELASPPLYRLPDGVAAPMLSSPPHRHLAAPTALLDRVPPLGINRHDAQHHRETDQGHVPAPQHPPRSRGVSPVLHSLSSLSPTVAHTPVAGTPAAPVESPALPGSGVYPFTEGVHRNCRGSWVALYRTDCGKRRTKTFNPKPNGELAAYHSAVDFRKSWEKKLFLVNGVDLPPTGRILDSDAAPPAEPPPPPPTVGPSGRPTPLQARWSSETGDRYVGPRPSAQHDGNDIIGHELRRSAAPRDHAV